MNGRLFPNVVQALLCLAVIGATTYLASVNQLAPELVGGVFILVLQQVFRQAEREHETARISAAPTAPAPAPTPDEAEVFA